MINLENIKSEKCQSPLHRLLRRPAPPPLFLIFHIPPPGEVIKIYFSPLKREEGVGGSELYYINHFDWYTYF